MAPNRSVEYVDLGYSSARQFWEEAGLAAYRRFEENANRQTVIDACSHGWHIHEWLWHEENPGENTRNNQAYTAFRAELIGQCEELAWVRDVADASKHRGLGRPHQIAGVHRGGSGPLSIGGRVITIGGKSINVSTPMTLELTDGTRHALPLILKSVVDFWNRRLGVES